MQMDQKEIEVRMMAVASEFAAQRAMLGDRSVQLAVDNALLRSENEQLKNRVAELEK